METHKKKKITLTSRRGNPLAQIQKIMFYTVDMEVEIDVQDAFENLTRNEKQGFINENINRASDERLIAEIQKRGLKIAKDANYQELVSGACKMFLVGGMTARDFLTDSLGLSHAASIDEIINNLKSVLQ